MMGAAQEQKKKAIDQNCNKTWVSLLFIAAESQRLPLLSRARPHDPLCCEFQSSSESVKAESDTYVGRCSQGSVVRNFSFRLTGSDSTFKSRFYLFLIFFFPFFRCNPILQCGWTGFRTKLPETIPRCVADEWNLILASRSLSRKRKCEWAQIGFVKMWRFRLWWKLVFFMTEVEMWTDFHFVIHAWMAPALL